MLARDERFFEIPGLAAEFVVQACIASRYELELVRHVLYLQGCPDRRFVKLGQVTILFRYGYTVSPGDLARSLFTGSDRLQAHWRQSTSGHSPDVKAINGFHLR